MTTQVKLSYLFQLRNHFLNSALVLKESNLVNKEATFLILVKIQQLFGDFSDILSQLTKHEIWNKNFYTSFVF